MKEELLCEGVEAPVVELLPAPGVKDIVKGSTSIGDAK